MRFAAPYAGLRLLTTVIATVAIIGGYAQASPQVTGYVRLSDGRRLPHVSVRVTNVGETTTTDSGEFIINLPSVFGPGDPIVLSVQNWIIMRPYIGSRGRVFLPKGSKEPIEVVVSKKGDKDLLTVDQIQHIIQEAISPLKVDSPSTDPRPDDFLMHTAEEIGVSVPRLKEAIERWASQVEGLHQKGLVALYQGRYADASGLLEASVGNAEGDLAQKYQDLATAYYFQQRYPLAEASFRKALALSPQDIQLRNALGATLNEAGKYADALEVLNAALASYGKTETESSALAVTLNNLGFAYTHLGHYQQAEPYLQHARSIDENAFGPEDPEVAIDLNNLGKLYLDEGRLAEAEDALAKARAIHVKVFGSNTRDQSLTNLASLRKAQGRYSEAREMFEWVVAIDKESGQIRDSSAATHLGNLAMLYFQLGDTSRAQPLLEEALRLDTSSLGPWHPAVAIDKMNIARVYMSHENYAAALALLENARQIVEAGEGDRTDLGAVFNLLASCYAGLDRYPEAKTVLLAALDIDTDAFGATSIASVSDRNSMAEVLRNGKEYVEAVPWYREALCIEEMTRGENSVEAATIAWNWSLLYFDWQKYEEAEPLLKRALRVYVAKFGNDNIRTATTMKRLANVLYRLGNTAEARQFERQAQAIHDSLSKDGPK